MDPSISRDEMRVLECITENVPADEKVYIAGEATIYFPAVTDRMIAFDDPIRHYQILDVLESYNVSGARDEIMDMGIRYAYISREQAADLFKELDGVEEICSSEGYSLFEMVGDS